MDKFELQKLRDLPIEGVAERLGLAVSRHKALCPFHTDKHPSLMFNVRRNSYHCFVCGAKGGVIDLVMNVLHKDFLEACKWLGNEHNVIVSVQNSPPRGEDGRGSESPPKQRDLGGLYSRFFERPWLLPDARKFLFDQRHIDPRVVRWCRLNSYQDRRGATWLQIPYYDQLGRLIGVQSRNLQPLQPPAEGEEPQPRFRFPHGSRCSIYNLPVLSKLQANDELYISEGCSDCWALLSAGHKAIAIPSATLLKEAEFLGAIMPVCRQVEGITLHMYPDQDMPGEMLFLQLSDQLRRIGVPLVRHTLPPDCKDFGEYYRQQKNKPD